MPLWPSVIIISVVPAPTPVMSFTPVAFAFIAVVVETVAFDKIGPVFSFKNGMIMFVVDMITVMTVPCRIGIISIAGIIPFEAKVYIHMDLGVGGIGREATRDDQGKNK
jgi:hypothetical protein